MGMLAFFCSVGRRPYEKHRFQIPIQTHALKYFRQAQKTGKPLIITDHAKPVLKIVPFQEDPRQLLKAMKGSVLRYDNPTEPIGEEDWEAEK